MTTPDTDVARLHAEAIRARLATQLSTVDYTMPVFLGEVTTDEADITYPYAVVWPSPARRETHLLAGYDGSATTTMQITVAGSSPAEVLAQLDRASYALHRWRPTVAGRACDLVTVDGTTAAPPRPDTRVRTPEARPVYVGYLDIAFGSTPDGS